jgi:avirulence protein
MIERVGVALVLRPPDLRTLTPQDQRYGSEFHRASVTLANEIVQGRLPQLQDLWVRCREWRLHQWEQALARRPQLDRSDPGVAARIMAQRQSFATSREGGVDVQTLTPIVRQYESIVPKILQAAPQPCLSPLDDQPALTFAQSLTLDGRKIELTRLFVHVNDDGSRVVCRQVPRKDGHPSSGYMRHTEQSDAVVLMAHANQLYQRVRSPGVATAEARRDLLAEMHWILAHAMPDNRGSAAKSELAVRASALAVGLDLPPFRPEIGPDLEAFVTPLPVFVQRYRGDYFMDPGRP